MKLNRYKFTSTYSHTGTPDTGYHFNLQFSVASEDFDAVGLARYTAKMKTNTLGWHGFLFIFKDLLFHFELLYYYV